MTSYVNSFETKNFQNVLIQGDAVAFPGCCYKGAEAIRKGISKGRVIKLLYWDAKNAITVRKVRPEALVQMKCQWYLIGYCFLRNDFRSFALYRVQTAVLTSQAAPPTEYAQNLKKEFLQLRAERRRREAKRRLAAQRATKADRRTEVVLVVVKLAVKVALLAAVVWGVLAVMNHQPL